MNDITKENIKGEIFSVTFILIVFLLAIPFYKIKPEYSRKEIHIMLGNFYFIALFYFTEWYFACFGPFVFIFVNYFSVKYQFIKLMLRHEEEKNNIKIKKDYGTVYYAISLTILTAYSWKIKKPDIGLCPFLSMAFGDGLACVIGRAIHSPYTIIFGAKKSIAGSLTMFFVTFILFFVYFWLYNIKYWIFKSFFMGLYSMIMEAFSPYGTDNLTVPLGNLLIMSFLM
jgi:phytol kinase